MRLRGVSVTKRFLDVIGQKFYITTRGNLAKAAMPADHTGVVHFRSREGCALAPALQRAFVGLGVFVTALAGAEVASATAILPGFDLWHTPAGQATLDIPGVGIVPLQSRNLISAQPRSPSHSHRAGAG